MSRDRVQPCRPLTGLLAACLLLVASRAMAAEPALVVEIDTIASHIGFSMATRWGQQLDGSFPHYRGQVIQHPDGRHQVRLQFDTDTVEIADHPAYTRFARGSGFFDARDWPHVDFLSDPYRPALLRDGGKLGGELSIRGMRHRENFLIRPATCARPGIDCDAVATGTIQRSDYGMRLWGFALSGEVVFKLRIRLRPESDG